MNTSKLKEALVELQHQRTILDGAISQLQNIVAMMNGGTQAINGEDHIKQRTPSFIDYGVEILGIAGQPVHVKELAKKISEMCGREVTRASVESTISQNSRARGDHARIIKTSPGYFGLPSWTAALQQPQLTNTV